MKRDWLTTSETAKILGYKTTQSTLDLFKSGEIVGEYSTDGKRALLITAASVDAYMSRRRGRTRAKNLYGQVFDGITHGDVLFMDSALQSALLNFLKDCAHAGHRTNKKEINDAK